MVKYDRRKGVMSMAEKEIVDRTKNEIAAGGGIIFLHRDRKYASQVIFSYHSK